MAERPDIPHIITTDTSSAHDFHLEPPTDADHDHDALSPSPLSSVSPPAPASPLQIPGTLGAPTGADFLTPIYPGKLPAGGSGSAREQRTSLDVPSSPSSYGRSLSPSHYYASSNEGGNLSAPPSPTLSNRSSLVHFNTTVDLRDNKPDEHSGLGSLDILRHAAGHRRKNSWASTTRSYDGSAEDSQPTEPDHDHSQGSSTRIASTERDSPSSSQKRKGKAPATGDAQDDEGRRSGAGDSPKQEIKLNLAEDDAIQLAPFAHAPNHLASLVDPKNLDLLTEMGGIEGLLKGLGTHRTHGLSKAALLSRSGGKQAQGKSGSAGGQRHDRLDEESLGDLKSGAVSDAGDPDDGDDDGAYSADYEKRTAVYGRNVLPSRKSKSLWELMWAALKDKVLILLTIAAAVSLALGLFQDFGTNRPACEPPVDWVEGVAIVVAVMIVVGVGSLNDWQKEKQFKELNDKKDERRVKTIRFGQECTVDIKDIVVGDVCLLEPGEIIPVDGVFLTGHNVKCDETSATGESDTIKKVSYEEHLALMASDHPPKHTDCFLISGAKVQEGVGSYVVIAVGQKSFYGRLMMALGTPVEDTQLQLKLNALAELIAKMGSIAGLILFVALLIRFLVQVGQNNPPRTANQKGLEFVQILIIAVTLVVVAVPEGLPLAVTLALAFATKRMTKENLLVRVLGSCEIMSNASVICTDKTGTLTQNQMTVVAGSIGVNAKFVRYLEQNQTRTNVDGGQEEQAGSVSAEDADEEHPVTNISTTEHRADFSLDQSEINDILTPQLRELFNQAIAINSTAFEDIDQATGQIAFVGNKTESALLNFAKNLGWEDYRRTREQAEVVQMIPFSSERKAMGVIVRLGRNKVRLYLKGASELLTNKSSRYVVVEGKGRAAEPTSPMAWSDGEVDTRPMDAMAQENVKRTIIFYANQTLRTIALCYRDFDSWPPRGMQVTDGDVPYNQLATDLTLIAITGIEDPLREGVREAVADCHRAGVTVKMCTGDNVLTARSIALQCGIYTPGGVIMEGPKFRKLPIREMMEVVPKLQVLARSSPEDKQLLVERLKELGEIVGVTGDGTNDGPALKKANVGFSMGIAGTEVAKEASDIILMDDNFASIIKAIMWGRCVNDAVRKFLQFQLSVNVTAVVVTLVTAIASPQEESALSAVQLLWINIIMDTFAALALATDKATPNLLDRKPGRKGESLFTVDMYKQILGQAAYTTFITLLFHFLGEKWLNLPVGTPCAGGTSGASETSVLSTLVFNAFTFSQIFNSLNCRSLTKDLNVFAGITQNYYFIGVTLVEVGAQILICFVGGDAFSVKPMGGREWGISLALGFLALPLGALIRLIPNGPCQWLFVKVHLMRDPDDIPMTRPDFDSTEWNSAINLVRDNLGMFAHVRGGRVRSSSFVKMSRQSKPVRANRVGAPSLLAMVPTLVASSVGAGWTPQFPGEGSLSDPASNDPSRSSAALFAGQIQVHPETDREDPAYKKYGRRDDP